MLRWHIACTRADMLRRLPASLVALPLLSLIVCFAACSSTTVIKETDPPPTDNPDAGDDPDTGEVPDSSTPDTYVPPPATLSFPQVVNKSGKTVASPKIVPIVFSGDPMISQITTFTQNLAVSDFWKTQGVEYGVGPITPKATVTLTEAAPTNIAVTAITSWLQTKLASGELGTPDASTLYAIYYPSSTTITDDGSGLGQSCQGYGGYHDETTVNGVSVGYAVLPRCSDIDQLTIAASHEYFEWATDPLPETVPAYERLDAAHWAWGAVMFPELGDLCTFEDQQNLRPTEIGFEVQRMWSNKASAAGTYPCAPNNSLPFYAAIPSATDDVEVQDSIDGSMIATKMINVPPGTTRKVDVYIHSDQKSTAQVPLRALSYADFNMSGQSSGFSYALSKEFGTVGETVQLEITAPTAPGNDYLVMMAYTSDQTAFYWPVIVANQPASLRAPLATALRRTSHHITKLGMGKVAPKLLLPKP